LDILDLYPAPVTGVVGRILPSENPGQTEAVIVLPARGKINVVNEVGARIWSLIDGSRSVREIAGMICQEYRVEAVQAQVDTSQFISSLSDRGAITLTGEPRS
jgi:hypothetical protein